MNWLAEARRRRKEGVCRKKQDFALFIFLIFCCTGIFWGEKEGERRTRRKRADRREVRREGMSGGVDIDLESLLTLSSLMKQWRDVHGEGLAHLEAIPKLFDIATAGAGTDGVARDLAGAVGRAAAVAPSPRLEAFLAAGWNHPSVVAAAPQKLTDAIDGAVAAAESALKIARDAERALDAFRSSVAIVGDSNPGGGDDECGRHWMDDVPVPVLLTRVPWGANRTIEEWLWLCVAVVEGVVSEADVKAGVAAYLSQRPIDEGGGCEVEALEKGKLLGCAEVWGLQPYVDVTLFAALADGGDD